MRFRHWCAVILITAGVNAGIRAGDDPCDQAGILVDGVNELAGLPVDHTDGDETGFLKWICLGRYCDLMPCFPSLEFRWAEYTSTCTEAMSITTYDSEGEVGPAPLVLSTCECRLSYWRPPLCVMVAECPLNRHSIGFLAVQGKSYTLAIFGGDTAVIEPLEELMDLCDYYWFGHYTGWFYDDVAAFVSCQMDCDSPPCSKCFDADDDGEVSLRDFAEFQNNAPW